MGEELKPIVVQSADTVLPDDAPVPLRGEGGGPLRIPARGGARALVVVTWAPDEAHAQDGALVLYGCVGSYRVALAAAHFTAADAGVTAPAFSVGGYPFSHYEIDGIAAAGEFGRMSARALAMVSASAGSEADVSVLNAFSKPSRSSGVGFLSDVLLKLTGGWISASRARPVQGRRWVSITTDDATDLAIRPTDGVYVGTAGNLEIDDEAGNTVIIPNLAAGMVHSINAVRIRATNTTAGGIFAVYGM